MPRTARRRRRAPRDVRIPLNMVRIGAYFPAAAPPPGQLYVALYASEPLMPVGITQIQVIYKVSLGVGGLTPVLSTLMPDPQTILLACTNAVAPLGVYIPYNDPGFRGINGGMLNPGEIACRATAPAPFPWVPAVG